MTPAIRVTYTIRLAGAATAAVLMVAAPAEAQQSCSALPNPTVVVGSNDFEPLLRQFAVRLSAESPPTTVVVPTSASLATSCAGVASVVDGADLAGLVGRYYTQSGSMITSNTCTFASGQTAQVAISDLFYESCATVAQPKPADIVDALGPAQEIVFAVPKANTTVQSLTYNEVATIYGCGVSMAAPVAGFFSDPTAVFCRDPPESGSQIAVARSIGLPESVMIPPKCTAFRNESTLASKLVPNISMPPIPASDYVPPLTAIGFVSAVNLGPNRSSINTVAFQAQGQMLAYRADSRPELADRANVRDGHYPIWGYVHLIAKTSGGGIATQAADLIGWINGTKTSRNIDPVAIEANLSLIPQCAMRVKRSSDGGLLSPYSPPTTCNCEYEAVATQTSPAACTACTSSSMCAGSSTCRHGFCE